eukprot:102005_1
MDDEPTDDAFKNIIMVNMNINNDDTQSISTIDNNYKNKYINKNINVYQILELNKERATLTQKISSSSKNIPIPAPPKSPIKIIKQIKVLLLKLDQVIKYMKVL